jgi:hypothetical protein
MIPKTGKLIINGKQYKHRYDKNEDYGVDGQGIVFYEILKEWFLCGWKLTVSRKKEMKPPYDFMTLAFDPPEKAQEEK